ncbi:gluconokinase [Mesorhizobium sp.]|uniref:gluconokinase n=2 Tax=Mesorhizobium sp. TaxID=1871066 RepID=UPI00258004EC|nr:gluconokinase [Mesorhizobium sp.]
MSMAASRPASEPALIVVMGVSGCGKTSIGEGIAARLGIEFVEGDALHPRQNVEKMSAGVPLDDADRWPWLDLVGKALRTAQGDGLVVTCSALKKAYRDRLRQAAGGDLVFVFLEGSHQLLRQRIGERRGHFMPPSLLDSQFATLEDPTAEQGVVTVNIAATVDAIMDAACARLAEMGIGAQIQQMKGT